MKRVMVIGCCGAGKSTYAKALHAITQLELISLDKQYWKPNWEEPNKSDWKNNVQSLAAKNSWIIDGNYGGTIDIRLERADTVIFLDYPTWICLWRVILRTIKNKGKVRSDMAIGCPERFDLSFLIYVATFNFKKRKPLLDKLNALNYGKKILIFRNDGEATNFLKRVKID